MLVEVVLSDALLAFEEDKKPEVRLLVDFSASTRLEFPEDVVVRRVLDVVRL
jgi:hypothetical protein